MGKILKTASERHEATLSPFLKDFIAQTTSLPTRELRKHLTDFPSLWPFPRGDLYHWISVLDRFDTILGQFSEQYGLDKGPQTIPFGNTLVSEQESKQDKGRVPAATNGVQQETAEESDVELVKTILNFTVLLLSNCGNRSLYASSDRLNDLLNTVDLSLLQLTLQLSLLLAKRYYSSKQRMGAVGGTTSLSQHYNISLDRVRKLAAPFASPAPPPRQPDSPSASAKGKEKRLSRLNKSSLTGSSEPKLNGSDFVSIVKNDGPQSSWKQWADVKFTFYPDKAWMSEHGTKSQEDAPETPVIRRTTTSPAVSRSSGERNVIIHRRRSLGDEAESGSMRPAMDIDISPDFIASHRLEDAVRTNIEGYKLPESSHFEFLQRLRVAKALISNREDRHTIVGIRLLAIANLAFVESEPTFYAEFARTDSEQPRQMQVAFQLAELVQPASDDPNSQVPLELQAAALATMDALTHQKLRSNDIYTALNANVNHGILFYMVRKAVDQLRQDEPAPRPVEEEWREALFNLLSSLPTVMQRAGELMMSAGLLDILLEVLNLRTTQAERTHWKALTFLDTFVYSVRDGYQTFASAKGLDIAKGLTAYVVSTSLKLAQEGEGIPEAYRAPITDYQIPFYKQSTLRWLFKFINHLMAHNNANFGRQMRNLIDSPEMLESFRTVMSHANVFGSNVWAGAVSIWTTFINNEPTSYSVIAESKLGECFLEALTQPPQLAALKETGVDIGLLPVSEAINAVPLAFQALCLNEAGMKLVVDSGALPKFFKIFTSPLHVKALDQDRELAQNLGSAFDELCRHQPTLRKDISAAVRGMVAQVAKLCNERATKDGFGAKLWVANDEGKLFVAGGYEALSGKRTGVDLTSDTVEDVEMTDSDAEPSSPQDQISMEEVIASRLPAKLPYPTAYVGAATRFLIYYLANSSMCADFIKDGGVENALDLATSPCLPFSFEAMNCAYLHDELGRMLSILSESKVYILLPVLTKRLQAVLSDLDGFLSHDDPSCAYFAPFTNVDRKSVNSDLKNPRFAAGTVYVKALVTINVLCNALCYIFTSPSMYSHRPNNSVFQQVNLTDVWVDIVERMGKLQRSCTWEEILLSSTMPPSWIKQTEMPHTLIEHDDVTDRILRFGDESATAASGSSDHPSNGQQSEEDHKKPGTPQFENTRVLRHLFYQAPYEISQFFNAMGKILLARRPDAVQKQNATLIAEQLAKSQTEALTFKLPQGYGEIKRLHEYWTVTLVRVSSIMIDDSYERTSPQTLTLILKAFKEQDGFAALEKVLESYVSDCKQLAAIETSDPSQLRDLANTMAGIKLVLHFYSRVINAKLVQDATQTQALAGRSSDPNSSEFSSSQFLVEMRYAVIKPAMRLWDESESAFMDKAITPVVRNLIEVLRIELDADSESKALTRKDKAPAKKKIEPRKWSVKNSTDLNRLTDQHGRDIAIEALYRCYDNMHNAGEYCDYAKQFGENGRLAPVPSDCITSLSRSRSPPRRPASSTPGAAESQPSEEASTAVASVLLDGDQGEGDGESSPPRLPVPQMSANVLREMILNTGGPTESDQQPSEALLRNLFTGMDSSREASQSPASHDDNRPLAGKVAGLVTVDDLNEERTKLRTSLIDRCLGILSVHDDVTFELAELIFASVSKGPGAKESRADIANTLLMSLTSLQMDDDASEEDIKQQNKRVACYAHLFALVLAKEEFYSLVEDELVENFPVLVGFITPDSVAKGSAAVANVLLILERLLSSDATPQQIEYKLPNPDADVIEKNAFVELKPSLILLRNKQLLFDALLNILLSVGKNETLALSILRVVVILTRNRKIAVQLGEKQNIRRLFLMARQLQGMTDEKIQGTFLITLRHIIEDEETLRNIMRNEIVAAWSTRPHGRPFDTTTYSRHFSQMAIRSPETFVKATNDKVAISNYNTRQVPQTLKLKEDPAAGPPPQASTANGESSKATEENKPAQAESAGKDKMDVERTKSHELKMPVVENPDGVIHFILSELLNYKEVEDSEPAADKAEKKDEQTTSASNDVEMGNVASSSSSPAPAAESSSNKEQAKKDDKPSFKAEDHPVYIYRCSLLQCLTELLSCYNRTKIEFINFKRKADAPGTTPSKPRSQVLNYLLHDLIPTGTLGHPEDITAKKRDKTSAWAMSVIVALCSKTGEGGFTRPPTDFANYKEEPELLFVRKFVLEHAIKSYRDAMTNDSEGLEQRYSRLLCLAELFNRMLTGKPNGSPSSVNVDLEMLLVSQRMLAKIMYEKNFISAMTSSIAEVDLNFPNAKRAVKYILKPLRLLTQTANELSLHSEVPVAPGSAEEEEISSDSEVSTDEEPREQTPDLFRNSALGILEPTRDEDSDEDEEDDDDDEDMYGDEFDEEMEYDEEMPHDHDEVVSDEEREIAEMGPIEGLPGDVGMDMEIVGMEVEDDEDEDEEDSSDEDEDGEDEDDDEDIDDMEDVIGMDEEGSPGADDEDWESQPEDEDGEDYPGQDEIEGDFQTHPPDMPAALDEIVRVLESGGDDRDEILHRLEDEFDGDIPEDHEIIDGDLQEEDEDDEEDYDEEEIAFEPELDDDEDFDTGRGVPWGWEEGERGPGHRHHHHHVHSHRHSPWGLFSDFRERIFPSTSAYRSHRAGDSQRRNDDGTNPLLHRSGSQATSRPSPHDIIGLSGGLGRFEIPADSNPASFLNSLITAMSAGTVLPGAIHHRGGTLHVQINNAGLGPMPRDLEQLLMRTAPSGRRPGTDASRTTRDDPSTAVLFTPSLTMARWGEESRILFGIGAQDKASLVVNAILRLLVPPAIEEMKRKEKEEQERQKKLEEEREKARKEKEEQERKEREEEEARKKKEEEERRAAEAEAAARAAESGAGEEQMEGVEATAPEPEAPAAAGASAAEPTQRITTMIDGREIDITNLGIDPDYLAALPDDMRQEVIMEQTLAQRQTATETGGQQQELDPEFLQALPPEMREELMQQFAHDRRRQEREAARRRDVASGTPARPDDMDPATFFATLDPALRSQLLMEVDDESLGALPPHLQAEARQLSGHHRRLDHYVDVNNLARGDFAGRGTRTGEESAQKRKPTIYAQILDKAGVATLLRLMFIQQSSSIRNSLNGILRDVCHNKQNRAEVVSILLSILQDGSNDIGAVERSFSLLSLRAKQSSSTHKTPQPKRISSEFGNGVGEMSPVTVVQQCLVCLEGLVQFNPRIAEFFLTEHETGSGFKQRSTRKGKGKETKATKYPINALLGLLDRKVIIESAPVMELLASLLQRITHPLLVLLRKEKQEKEKAAEEEKKEVKSAEETAQAGEAAAHQLATTDVEMASPEHSAAAAPEAPEPPAEGAAEQKSDDKPAELSEDKVKKRTLTPPDVPEYNLRLIINIVAARECPSKTFKDTLSLITNLSTIPEAKEIFGQELIRQAQDLGRNILEDLQELEGQIRKALNGADVQGMALAKFSPASSDQAKLLRVITALDFLFDPKRADTQDKPATSDAQSLGTQQKEDILTTLYENKIFVSLWDKLSTCLKEIHERENMFSVANILLPLIEVLMVVCKNTTLKDAPIKNTQQDFSLSSPEPESKEQRMESLFFRFTEDHRKILNELVRHNPKLMSGSFSLLVKNSKVLEFDNKRNYFTRRLHSRGQEVRQPHPSLQLSVRRDQVFLDSFKHLYYKKPEEFKYGKLSIRFAGEEGVDAGGVTREWFQALTKQMFDPNYALFIPVAADRTTFHPNSESAINEQHLTFFKFIGRIIGKALYEGRVLDCHFSRAVYKRILGRSISIKDMESLDNDYAKNLQWILDNDITDLITETFSVSTDAFGEEKVVDLVPNGRDIEVTEENKHEYVQRVVEYKLIGSVKEQMEHFLQGFHDIVPADLVSIFNEQELELLISGLPDIDVEDWRNNAEYHNYTSSSPQIQWFWRAVRSFDKEERAKLLQFVTGTSKVPLNGFKELEGMNGFSRFNIHRDYGNKDRLPSSHTCFNQLDLPEYDSYEDLRKALYTAITTGSEYFGFA